MAVNPTFPCPAPFNLAAYVLAGSGAPDDRIALELLGDTTERWDYGRLQRTILGSAGGLASLGAPRGARVLLRLDNTVDFPVAYLAAIAAGLVPVPTSAALTVPEVSEIAQDLRPALILSAPGVALPEPLPCPVLPLGDLRAMASSKPLDPETGEPERPAYIVYTSGTGGQARGVVHAHRAIWARRMMWDGWYGLRGDDRLLHAGAFNWTYTLGTGLLDPWAAGATALIPAPGTPATALPDLLASHRATIFAAAPGVYRQMLRAAVPPLPALRHGLSAGEKLPDATRAQWQTATGTAVHEAFGMSECSTFISGSPTHPAPPGTLGFAQHGRRVAILRDGQPAPPDTPGTIAIHRDDPGLMLGYLGDDALSGDWFETGDMGAMDDCGAVTYLGRADDMLNAGGFRVSPLEVEAALTTHPEIAEAAAVALRPKPDTTLIGAFYVSTSPLDEATLTAHAAARLARYKCPRIWVHMDALPRGANNKLLRRALRDQYEAENG
ncbi:MAG: AMP-binding protein [Rhodobacteraceae bacterium]|nr:AMP-binding protein [Paracoccaceae bacterium]